MKEYNILKDIESIKINLSKKCQQVDRLNTRLQNIKNKFILNKKMRCKHCVNNYLLKDSIIICRETAGSFNSGMDDYDWTYEYYYICKTCNSLLDSLDFEKELESIGFSIPYNKILQSLDIQYSTWSSPGNRMPELLRQAMDKLL